ncbi:ATP-dependent RNA helicase HrpA, partial [Oleiphilus sp. HI0043]
LSSHGDDNALEEKLEKLTQEIEESKDRLSKKINRPVSIKYPPQLPVSQKVDDISKAIKDNQVVIVAGETGSGKTTQLPKACLQAGLGRKGLIGHTQPRRLAARTVSTRLAEELNSPLGDLVGYQVRFTDQVSDSTLIKVMTDGILLNEIKFDRYLNRYEVIIIDEAHERSLNIDFLLGYLKRVLLKRPELKLIITSATIDVDRFSEFFTGAPIFSVSGRSYPVDVNYRPSIGADVQELSLGEQIATVVEEIQDEERQRSWQVGDVLVFLPGEREIREIAKTLNDYEWRDTEILPLYARLSTKDQSRVFQPHSGRRIILSTNVAETSITVPGIRYVIDPGTVRISRYSYRSKLQRLPIESISQASANQRKGRCGRIAEGICYRLYSEDDFISRPEFTDPEIQRTNLAAVILKMIDSGLGAVKDFQFIDPPDSRLLNDGYKLLFELQAVDENNRLTALGKKLATLPTDPRLGRMLLSAQDLNAVKEVLIIVSGLSIQDPRERPADKQQAADQAHAEYKDPESDFLSFLRLWEFFEDKRQELSNNQLKRFCQKNFLSAVRMREWREIHRQLLLVLKSIGIKENDSEASYDSIHKALLSGLLGNIGKHEEKREYQGCRNRRFHLFPGSGVNKKRPKWLFAAEIVETQQVYSRYNARLDPAWIEPLAKHLVKRSYAEPHWEAKRAQIIAKEKVTLYGLEIVSQRPVNYSQIDPGVCREIFIRTGLIEREFRTKNKAIAHNLKLIDEVESIEDRTRRKDVLVDDEVIYGLYDKALPEHIVSGAAFEKWAKKASEADSKLIRFTKGQLRSENADSFDPGLYPEHIENNGIRFPLSYQFKPGAEDDGVNISVPINAIKQLTVDKLEKIVPGLLREKCIHLIKTLPRTLRKHFVPVPDVVDKILPKVEASSRPLLEILSDELKIIGSISIPIEAWNLESLDSHLRFNIKVLDERGRLINQGRDLVKLSQKVEHLAKNAAKLEENRPEKQVDITAWDFGELKQSQIIKQAGIEMMQYPALQDCGAHIRLIHCNDKLGAEAITRIGIARLLSFELQGIRSQFKKAIKNYQKLGLLYAPVGQASALYDDFLIAAICLHFLNGELPRNAEQFSACLQGGKGDFLKICEEFSALVFDILNHYHQIMKRLKGKMNLAVAMPMADLKHQITCLVYDGFLQSTPYTSLKSFPRYLQACSLRYDKMARDMANERRYVPLLSEWWEQYELRKKQLDAQGLKCENLERFRWLLEEQRVSWYSQQLGTSETVSEKRLNKLWESVRR